MSDQPLLYIADSDSAFRQEASNELAGDFEVRCFADGISCVSLLSEKPPAILMLASNLEDAPALDLCRDIREDGQLRDTHLILLLPANASQADIDEAHAAGCDEVLAQPVDLPNLRRQLRTTYRLASERSSFRQQASYAQQVAMTAMTSMGELGVVLQFLSKCFACGTFQAVAQETLSALSQYGLSGAIQIRAGHDTLTESTPGGSPADDAEVIGKLHGIGRIFEFKTRMVINYDHATILMNDVPDDNEVRGRIRDNVAMLAEGAHARVFSLLIEQDNRRKQGGIRFALNEILHMTAELRDQQKSSQEQGQQAVNGVIEDFETSFIRMGLTASQESDLIALLVSLRQEVSSIGLTADEIDRKLQRVVRSLQSIAEEQF
ncbi:MAG: hypothetical protein L6Q40_00585 [Azonexus sp.]|nr:hypothetical protein [Azonexus sp.]